MFEPSSAWVESAERLAGPYPLDNVLSATHGRDGKTAVDLLVERVTHLLDNVRVARCPECNAPVD
jgi:hypothetical protein